MDTPETNILFSIIIPVYNTDPHLVQRCMQSVRSLTYTHFECLIVDDGSEADCAGQLDLLAAEDARFQVLHIPHGGNSKSRNAGIREAQGDYIMFIDADDAVYPDLLTHAYALIKRCRPDMVQGLVRFYAENDSPPADNRPLQDTHLFFLKDKTEFNTYINHILGYETNQYVFPNGYISRGPVARVCKTSLVKQHLFPDGDLLYEDIIWNLGFIAQASSIVIIPETWYAYYQYPGSKSHRFQKNGEEKFDIQVRAYYDTCCRYWPDCRKGLYISLWHMIAMYFRFYLGNPDNPQTWAKRYALFKEIPKRPEYAETFSSITFPRNRRHLARMFKEVTLFLMKHRILLPAWFIWKKAASGGA